MVGIEIGNLIIQTSKGDLGVILFTTATLTCFFLVLDSMQIRTKKNAARLYLLWAIFFGVISALLLWAYALA